MRLAGPIVAAAMFMGDERPPQFPWKEPPNIPNWTTARFDAADMLFVTPFGIQPDGKFRFNTGAEGDLTNRVQWIVQNARADNPDVKIIPTQFFSTEDGVWGANFVDRAKTNPWTTETIETYAQSVQDLMRESMDSKSGMAGGFDGWDVDYEWDSRGLGSMVPEIGKIVKAVRTKLDELSKETGRKFYVTMTPATTDFLGDEIDESTGNAVIADSVDYIVMQNYDGGSSATPERYLSSIKGLKTSQLMYGVTAEVPSKNVKSTTVNDIMNNYNMALNGGKEQMSGVMVWRLNSDNYAFESAAQVTFWNHLHPNKKLADSPDIKDVARDWYTGGRDAPLPQGQLKKEWIDWVKNERKAPKATKSAEPEATKSAEPTKAAEPTKEPETKEPLTGDSGSEDDSGPDRVGTISSGGSDITPSQGGSYGQGGSSDIPSAPAPVSAPASYGGTVKYDEPSHTYGQPTTYGEPSNNTRKPKPYDPILEVLCQGPWAYMFPCNRAF